jgi:ABC-type nitrate/sulfonate/bicarbonate transport system ATPase subunit
MGGNDKLQVTVNSLNKVFMRGGIAPAPVLKELSFSVSISRGAVNIFLIPSKAGATSLMKIIAGLDKDFSGEVKLSLSTAAEAPRKIVFIPSEPSSFPWLNVEENIIYSAGEDAAQKEETVKKVIELTGLEGYEKHFPDNKSLGFRFRISLARALASIPDVIILDNPFRNMDKMTREELYPVIISAAQNYAPFFILATDNITEASGFKGGTNLFGSNPFRLIEKDLLSDNGGENIIPDLIAHNKLSGFSV